MFQSTVTFYHRCVRTRVYCERHCKKVYRRLHCRVRVKFKAVLNARSHTVAPVLNWSPQQRLVQFSFKLTRSTATLLLLTSSCNRPQCFCVFPSGHVVSPSALVSPASLILQPLRQRWPSGAGARLLGNQKTTDKGWFLVQLDTFFLFFFYVFIIFKEVWVWGTLHSHLP